MKMYNIFNRLLIVFALLFIACENEETLIITEPEASFLLQQPSITSINLNFGLETNPAFTLSWSDEVTGSSNYDIEMALTDTFDTTVLLGNSSGNSFTINVMDLNTAINNANPEFLNEVPIFVRVNAGAVSSNSVLFSVNAYPVNAAVITNPTQNEVFVLDIASQDVVLFSFTWEDDALASLDNIDYIIEAAVTATDFEFTIPL